MTKAYGLEVGDLDIMDEAFFGPPPRFLVDGNGGGHDADPKPKPLYGVSLFPGIAKVRELIGAW